MSAYRSRPARLACLATLMTVAILVPATSTAAPEFPPQKLENLQIFPSTIPVKDLLETMKGFSQALGVRCWACHVGQEGQQLSEFDFVSDAKPDKKVARLMMQMTGQINNEYLKKLAEIHPEEQAPRVSCMTCHRGQKHPESSPPAKPAP